MSCDYLSHDHEFKYLKNPTQNKDKYGLCFVFIVIKLFVKLNFNVTYNFHNRFLTFFDRKILEII